MNLYKITSYYFWTFPGQTAADKVTEEVYVEAPTIEAAITCLPLDNRVQRIDILVGEHDLGKLLHYPESSIPRPWQEQKKEEKEVIHVDETTF